MKKYRRSSIVVLIIVFLLTVACSAGTLDVSGTPPPSLLGTPPPSEWTTPRVTVEVVVDRVHPTAAVTGTQTP